MGIERGRRGTRDWRREVRCLSMQPTSTPRPPLSRTLMDAAREIERGMQNMQRQTTCIIRNYYTWSVG